MELRARFPKAPGVWYSLIGRPWADTYPIVKLELINRGSSDKTQLYFGNEWAGAPVPDAERQMSSLVEGVDFSELHTFTIDWRPDSIEWRIDGVTKMTSKGAGVGHTPMYWTMGAWVGGWPGKPSDSVALPVSFEIADFSISRVDGVVGEPAERYEPTIAERFLTTERSMLKYLAYVAQPDGELPMLGVSQESTIQSRDPKLFGPLSSFDDEYAWAFSEGKGGRPLDRAVHLFPTSGLFVLRAGNAERRQTFVSFDAGAYRTDHSHLDALSVTIYSDGVTLCPDAGLFTYNYGPEYEYFHGTRGHNTVMVDGRDQTEGGAFAGAYGVDGSMSWATATSTAYYGVKHLRTIIALDQSLLLVTDDLSSDTEHDYTQTWHLFPKAQLSTQGVDVDVADETGAPILRMRQADSTSMKLETFFGATERMQGWISTLYNQKEPIHALEFDRKAKSATFATLFAMGPRAKAGAPTSVREQRDAATGDRVLGVCADGADLTVRIHREGTSDAMVTRVEGGGC